jgi:hypothetical protein
MSEQSFEEMLDETFKTIHTGEVVDGTVIDVKEDGLVGVAGTLTLLMPRRSMLLTLPPSLNVPPSA